MAAGRSSGRAVEDALERSRRSARVRREPRAEPFDLRRRAGVPLGRRALEETQRLVVVLRYAVAVCVTRAEVEERVCIALRRGEAVPPHSFLVGLRHTLAVVEELAPGGRSVLVGTSRLRSSAHLCRPPARIDMRIGDHPLRNEAPFRVTRHSPPRGRPRAGRPPPQRRRAPSPPRACRGAAPRRRPVARLGCLRDTRRG
mmetsp:Transcript_18308/g.63086  ORF Transcript_18308/g.63086 Transcript_18308/m.63086 type:complete len:200 (+) Transcript_18308:55-654(+)